MNKYRQFITYANYSAFLALLCVMPYAMPFIRFFGLVWIISWLMEGRFLRRPKLSRANLIITGGFIIWFIWNALSILWADDKQIAFGYVQRYLYLLAIPLVMLWGVNERYNWQQIVKVLFISSVVSVFVYLFTHYWLINAASAWDRLVPRQHDIDWLHLDDFLHGLKHRLHYSSFLTLTLAAGLFTLTAGSQKNISAEQRAVNICGLSAATIIILLACYWTGSRAAIINCAIVFALTVLYWWNHLPERKGLLPRPKWQKYGAAFTMVVIFIAAFLLMMRFHPRQKGLTLHEQLTIHQENSYSPATDPRVAIWHTALESPADYSLHGLGAGNSTNYIMKRYEAYGWEDYLYHRYSVHNQFLAAWIELGLAAGILWLLFWLAIPFLFAGRQRFWAALFIAICLVGLSTDLFIAGVEGIAFIIIGFVLLTISSGCGTKATVPVEDGCLPQDDGQTAQ